MISGKFARAEIFSFQLDVDEGWKNVISQAIDNDIYLVTGDSLGLHTLDDTDSLHNESHAIWRPLHRSHLHHIVLVQRLEAR